MQKPIFINDSIYHVYNRGVEKRQIFMEDYDYLRFVHNMFEFNDTEHAGRFSQGKKITVKVNRDLLVEILGFSLMPNHFHLILRQIKDGGLIYFMKKLGTGYAVHFNNKYDRVGSLFQGRFKAITVKQDQYLMQLSKYIHLNSLEIFDSEWKKKKVLTPEHIKFLDSYRWSSYLDYIGTKNFPSITHKDFILDMAGSKQKYHQFVTDSNFSQINLEL